SSAPPASNPKRKPLPLGALVAALPSNADAFLTRLDKCLSTPSGIDTVMLFVCYTSKLASSVLASLSRSALRRSAREWIALVAALPRGTTVVFSSPTSASGAAGKSAVPIPSAAALALLLSKRLASLSSLLSEARMILRLWALLGMYFWARGLVRRTLLARFQSRRQQPQQQPAATANEKDVATSSPPAPAPMTNTEAAVEWTRLLLCVAFQSLENAAYLSQRGVLGLTPAQQGKAYRWSARLWGGYVGVELGRLLAERVAPTQTQTKAERAEWTKKTVRQLAWAPLTIHWGSEKGLVSDTMVGLLASIPGIIQLRDLWASTA
ncbi:hypothetical protein N656DRAFT_696860, partial [Canariomyces notabilis]